MIALALNNIVEGLVFPWQLYQNLLGFLIHNDNHSCCSRMESLMFLHFSNSQKCWTFFSRTHWPFILFLLRNVYLSHLLITAIGCFIWGERLIYFLSLTYFRYYSSVWGVAGKILSHSASCSLTLFGVCCTMQKALVCYNPICWFFVSFLV